MRLFVAVLPPRRVLDAIDALPRPELQGVRWTRRDQWHVTLRFLGDLGDPEPVIAALDALRHHPPHVRLGPEVTVLGRRVVVLPASGLEAVAANVVRATAPIVEPDTTRPFDGHLTLARLRHGTPRPPSVIGVPFHAGWVARQLRLVRSHVDSDGSRYETLRRYDLRAP